jgi:MFS transporter, AAHS family, 4-hydroxybenzoate transporter
MRVLLALCAAIYFLDGLIHSILGPLAPDIARDLALGNGALGTVFSANLAGQCIGLVVAPWLAARFGQRGVVIASVAGFGIGQCASALADGFTSLFICRLLTGAFLGGCLPGCLAMVAAMAPPPRRGLAIMVLFMGYGSGATAAGVLAAAVGNWRSAMLIVGAACLATALLAFLWLRPRSDAGDGADAAHGAGLAGILSHRHLLGTLMLWLLFIAMLTISYCLNSWLPTVLVQVGRDAQLAAVSVSIFSFGGIVAALVIGLLIDRFGAGRTLAAFIGSSAVLLAALGQALPSAPVSVLVALLAASGFFALGAYGGINVILAGFYPPALQATGIGWAKSVGRLGTVIAPIGIGAALGAGASGQSVLALFALPALIALAALLVVVKRMPAGTQAR